MCPISEWILKYGNYSGAGEKVCVSVGTATSDALSVSLAHDKGISLGVEYLLRTGYKRIG
ncbi:hypothetical protein [Treponema phagedenis]|uniref:hypothetical protein n=1 Tax=Treponema phagedenis TaxID=162 RepID=UPI0011EC9EBD|nr:hypothetical protein [Treponema phagedenis]TYT76372.1 hypothetical protein FS559_15260 [Treponema phagedenis]